MQIEAFRNPADEAQGSRASPLDPATVPPPPDVLVATAEGIEATDFLTQARRLGSATVLFVNDPTGRRPGPSSDVDAIAVESRGAAAFLRAALDLDSTVLPPLVDRDRVRAEPGDRRFVTFIDPTVEAGVFVFARIADELGKRRPDIPLLVVEGLAGEADLVALGLDLRGGGNVHLMAPTEDPRAYWGVTRLALFPSLGWDGRARLGVAAAINGIPSLVGDRGGLGEVLGEAGVVLPLPGGITAATHEVPTAEEVGPWVEAILRLWDDPEAYEERRRKAIARAEAWRPERVTPEYVRFLEGVRPGSRVEVDGRGDRQGWAVLVPFLNAIEWECDRALRALEGAGVRVVRCRGSSAIDMARNTLASEALRRGAEAILFVDADIGFDPRDALRLLARPDPVVAGVYPKKASRELASAFAAGIEVVEFGPEALGLYPLEHAAAGFLRIRCEVLTNMAERLRLPLCNAEPGDGGGFWPFFHPLVIPQGEGRARYLSEDYAFSHRLRQMGITPMADTSCRLHHIGAYGYSWEDTTAPPLRYRTYSCRLREPTHSPPGEAP